MLTRTDWATLKAIKSLNTSFILYYVQDGTQYTVIEGNRFHQYWSIVKEPADVTDFETSYKPSAVSVISLDDAISRILFPEKTDNDQIVVLNNILAAVGGQVSSVITDHLFGTDTGRILTGSGEATLDTADTPLLLIRNPSGSGKNLKMYWRIYGVSVTNVMARFRLFVNPTVTSNGTSHSIVSARQTPPASTIALASINPTVSNLGTLMDTFIIGQNNSANTIFDNLTLWLEPGNSWLFAATPGSNNRPVEVAVKWVEEV